MTPALVGWLAVFAGYAAACLGTAWALDRRYLRFSPAAAGEDLRAGEGVKLNGCS